METENKKTTWTIINIISYVIIIIFVILFFRWIWDSGYKSAELDRMSDTEFNEKYGTPRPQEMREY